MQAQEGEWYIGANMPLMFIDDSDSNANTSFSSPQGPIELQSTVRSKHDTGFKLGAVLGHHLESNLRVEGEIFFARAEVSRLTHTSISLPDVPLPPDLLGDVDIPVSGTGDQFGAMVNLWYDFDTGDNWTPYVGGGLGLIRIDQSDLSYDPNAVKDKIGERALEWAQNNPQQAAQLVALLPLQTAEVPRLSTADTAFAYQIGAGIGYALSDTATLNIGYRLQALDGLSFSADNNGVATTTETDLRIHFLEIGIRQLF